MVASISAVPSASVPNVSAWAWPCGLAFGRVSLGVCGGAVPFALVGRASLGRRCALQMCGERGACVVLCGCVMSCQGGSCRVMSCRVVSGRVASCRVLSCRVASRRVASCIA